MFSSIPFRLHTDKEHKTYDNMQDWWVNQAKCSSNYIISQDDMIQKICTKFICICTYLVFSLSGCEFILMLLKIFRNQILPLFEIHFICTRYPSQRYFFCDFEMMEFLLCQYGGEITLRSPSQHPLRLPYVLSSGCEL